MYIYCLNKLMQPDLVINKKCELMTNQLPIFQQKTRTY